MPTPEDEDPATPRHASRGLSRQRWVFESFGSNTRITADLGVQPGGDITGAINNASASDTLFVFDEPGTYDLTGSISPAVASWGLAAQPGLSVTVNVAASTDAVLGDVTTPMAHGLFGGFRVSATADSALARFDLSTTNDGHVDFLDLPWVGAADVGVSTSPISISVGVGAEVRCERVRATDGGEPDAIRVRPDTTGAVDLIDTSIAGFDGAGVSMEGTEGAIHASGGSYRENAAGQILFCGPNSWADAVEIRAETVASAPGVRWIAGADHRQGGVVRNCEIHAHGDSPAVVGDEGAGPLSLETCNIETDGGGGVRAYTPATDRASPWKVFDTDIVGDDSSYAIDIDEREDSLVEECCIHLPNGEGVRFDHASPGTIAETRVNVGGTVWRHAQVEDCATEGECPPRSVL
jgi:hypothetical protein